MVYIYSIRNFEQDLRGCNKSDEKLRFGLGKVRWIKGMEINGTMSLWHKGYNFDIGGFEKLCWVIRDRDTSLWLIWLIIGNVYKKLRSFQRWNSLIIFGSYLLCMIGMVDIIKVL